MKDKKLVMILRKCSPFHILATCEVATEYRAVLAVNSSVKMFLYLIKYITMTENGGVHMRLYNLNIETGWRGGKVPLS
jgi:hypothetical protein